MKLEVYPTYAERLNEIVRGDRSKRGLWGDVIKYAAELMDHEDGRRNAYPRKPEGRPLDDPGVRDALRKIERGSERGRWVFLSIAAREILRREKQLLVLGVLVAILSIAIMPAAAVQDNSVIVFASPQEINRFDSFLITVKTGLPNTSFNLSISGRNGFYQLYQNRTDSVGLYVQNVSAYFDFGQYEIDASITNATSRVFVTVGCDAACTVDILHQNGLLQQQLVYAELEKWGLYAVLVLLGIEAPRTILYFRVIAKRARARGSFTPREAIAAPLIMLRGHFNPGDTVTDPKNPQNPRIEIDASRRELMEQLHVATSKPYMEWNPGHLDAIEDVFRDLKKTWVREREALPVAAPYAKTYARPPMAADFGCPDCGERHAVGECQRRLKIGQPAQLVQQLTPEAKIVRGIPPPPNGRNEMEPTPTPGKNVSEQKTAQPRAIPARAWKWAVVASGILGVPMAVLVLAARAGVYVDALRPLWVDWPGDPAKVGIGLGIFVVAVFGWRVAVRRSRTRPEQ